MKSSEHKIQFGTLNPNSELTNIRTIKQSDIAACKFTIMVSKHYRADGSCLCDDEEHRKMMIKEWGYTQESFNEGT